MGSSLTCHGFSVVIVGVIVEVADDSSETFSSFFFSNSCSSAQATCQFSHL